MSQLNQSVLRTAAGMLDACAEHLEPLCVGYGAEQMRFIAKELLGAAQADPPPQPEPSMKLRTASESVGWMTSEGPLTTSPRFEPRAAAPVEGGGWRDIESAPKDGSRMLLATTTGCVLEGWYPAFGQAWQTTLGIVTEPTHWMPLPSPPAARLVQGVPPAQTERKR